MSDEVRIVTNQERRYMTARPFDCIFLTYVADRHTPVMGGGISGTVTTRPGELGVLTEDETDRDRRGRVDDTIGIHHG